MSKSVEGVIYSQLMEPDTARLIREFAVVSRAYEKEWDYSTEIGNLFINNKVHIYTQLRIFSRYMKDKYIKYLQVYKVASLCLCRLWSNNTLILLVTLHDSWRGRILKSTDQGFIF